MIPEEEWEDEEEEEEDEGCDYGLSEFCEHPDLRELGCCFDCPLYLESLEEEKKQKEANP